MKILVLVDSFKNSISSLEAGKVISSALNLYNHDVDFYPISDGGEGWLISLSHILPIDIYQLEVVGPLGGKVIASYGINHQESTAYLELAEASGIQLVTADKLNPFQASTYGFGELIKNAILNHNVNKVVLGIGGSATCDGGAGLLEACGVVFKDESLNTIKDLNNQRLANLHRVDFTQFFELIKGVNFTTWSDVTNPLLGEKGAINVFGPQKGASLCDLPILEQHLNHFHQIISTTLQNDYSNIPGSGAAGGVGYSLFACFNSEIKSGIDSYLNLIKLDEISSQYNWIITGEGKLDNQSLDGKVVSGILKRVNHQKVIIVTGLNQLSSKIDVPVYAIVPIYATQIESMKNPKPYLEKICHQIEQELLK